MEYLLIGGVIAAVCVIHFWVNHKLIMINFFFIPVVITSLLLGKRVGGPMAAFCVVLVGLSAYLEPHRYQLGGNTQNYGALLAFDIVIWGAFLLLTALLVGHLPEMRAQQTHFRRIANVDGLTGLMSRRAFMERAEGAVSEARRHNLPLSFIMADLDCFKRCNDTYGHQMGDKALCRFARLLRDGCRKEDFAGRYGGDEFCLMLPHTPLSAAKTLAIRLNQLWSRIEFEHEGRVFRMGASFGVSCLEGEATHGNSQADAEDLVRRADLAMYAAKRSVSESVVAVDGEWQERQAV